MRTQTLHANVTKTAIGYVRVSTPEQATEGVSLDAQRDRLRSTCKANGIKLIDIIADEMNLANFNCVSCGGTSEGMLPDLSHSLREA